MKKSQEILLNITKVGMFNIATLPKQTHNPEWMNVTSSGDFPPDGGKNPGILADEHKKHEDFYNPFAPMVFPCGEHD